VSCFFFELDSVPVRQTSGTYHCRGTIRCRFPDVQALINALLGLTCAQMSFYKENKSLSCKLQQEDLCGTCQRYSRKVEFLVRTLEEPLTLSLRWQDRSRNLSAMPHPLAWFMRMQQMDSPFGSRNHGTPGAIQCPSCDIDPTSVGKIASCHTCNAHSSRKKSHTVSPRPEEAQPRKIRRIDNKVMDHRRHDTALGMEHRESVFTDL
jgi:hypothetical protein